MEFSVKSGSPEKQRSACIVVGVFEPRRLTAVAEQLDEISEGYISNLLRRGDLEGKAGQMLLLHNVPNVLSERVLLVGCGKERELDERQYKNIIAKTIQTLNETGSMEAVCFLTELHVKGRDTYWKVRQAVEATEDTLYTFMQLKTKKGEWLSLKHFSAKTKQTRPKNLIKTSIHINNFEFYKKIFSVRVIKTFSHCILLLLNKKTLNFST